ncbi:hypothetical protein [Prosthecobacter dejongeii]|uniref:Uncharacterized protein n=1 Tax=Prosthecobacter dejongeii TaxID=48465 RepID=A0A7W8DPV4_9BACT|nr:hypothetical protein [Prosthecobacter dejongeii]MBB5037565.1 hypothetical protein [Prosthecobacter dejongeii]
MSRSYKRTITTIALLAMLMVQLSGGIFHYYCDCTGKSAITLDEHCHGENGELGPLNHAPSGHEHDDDHDETPLNSDSHHHHDLVQTPTDTVPPDVAMAPVVCLMPIQLIEIFETTLASMKEPQLVAQPPPDEGGSPSLPLMVVRSVVFLI